MVKINLTQEFNMGPNSVLYEKFKPIMDYFPPEMSEMILNQLPEEDHIILSGTSKQDEEPVEGPDYDLPAHEEDFELFGNQALEESDNEEDDYLLF